MPLAISRVWNCAQRGRSFDCMRVRNSSRPCGFGIDIIVAGTGEGRCGVVGVVAVALELEGATVEMLIYDRFARCGNERNCKALAPDVAASPPPAAAAVVKLAPLPITVGLPADAAVSFINRVSRPHFPKGSGL